jgi:hypothetical protein
LIDDFNVGVLLVYDPFGHSIQGERFRTQAAPLVVSTSAGIWPSLRSGLVHWTANFLLTAIHDRMGSSHRLARAIHLALFGDAMILNHGQLAQAVRCSHVTLSRDWSAFVGRGEASTLHDVLTGIVLLRRIAAFAAVELGGRSGLGDATIRASDRGDNGSNLRDASMASDNLFLGAGRALPRSRLYRYCRRELDCTLAEARGSRIFYFIRWFLRGACGCIPRVQANERTRQRRRFP